MSVEQMIWEFFRISPTMLSGVFLNDIVNFILLPSVVLLVFLGMAADMFLHNVGTKWKGLISMVFYLVIIVQGWYGPFAMFAKSYIILFLIAAGTLFFITRFAMPEHGERSGRAVGGIAGKALRLRKLYKEKKFCEDEIRKVNDILSELEKNKRYQDREDIKDYKRKKANYEMRLKEIELEIDRIKRFY